MTKVNWKIHWPASLENSLMVAQDFFNSLLIGSVALLWQNAKRNVNPGLSYFKQCPLALLAKHLRLHFAFRQSKATFPMTVSEVLAIVQDRWKKQTNRR